jgi:hypothetical protein
MMDVIGITAVMMCPMVAIAVTLYYSHLATKDIGNDL